MLRYTIQQDPETGEEWIETELRGKALLTTYLLNKGTAFTEEERANLGLLGKLPARIETLAEQIARSYEQYKKYKNNLQRHIYLNNLHDRNEILFYKLVSEHLAEMIPIIYTPSISVAVQQYSHEFRQPRGLYIAYPDKENIELILENRTHPKIAVIVVTDGERILGIGDQGIGSINISIAKLMLYTMCGGMNPYHVLPIYLDVGTDNPKLLNDPFYLGWRHPRIRGHEYDAFVDKFVQAIKKKLPGAFLHWEDFARDNARRLLERYQNVLCTFNDDMQGTAMVTLAALLNAVQRNGSTLTEQRICIFGAGTAGVGIADAIVRSLKRLGLSDEEAYQRIWLVDRQGLLSQDMTDLISFQLPYARAALEKVAGLSLSETIDISRATVLIGCSAVSGAFNEQVVKKMLQYHPRPIIFPLSNPNEQSEADPKDLLAWTNGKGHIATGSPFGNQVAQCNNAYAFPGIGLGVIAARATCLNDNMLWAATKTLSEAADPSLNGALLPPLEAVKKISFQIAVSIVESARKAGVSQLPDSISASEAVQKILWEPYYRPIKPKADSS